MYSIVKLTQLQLILAGLQAGRKIRYKLFTSYWYVRFRWMSFGVINLNKTLQILRFVLNLVNSVIFSRNKLLYVGHAPKTSVFYKSFKSTGEPFTANNWVGGLLTNFKRLWRVYHFTKIGRLSSSKVLDLSVYDVLRRLPGMVFLDSLVSPVIPLNEASKLRIPVVSLVDVDYFNGHLVYAIPGNSSSFYSSYFLLNLLSLQIILAKIRLVLQFGKAKGIYLLYKNKANLRHDFKNLRYSFIRNHVRLKRPLKYKGKNIKSLYRVLRKDFYKQRFVKKYRHSFKKFSKFNRNKLS
jgi:ribosomal protein S2